ncbi:hypothetical protein LTS17_008686 [Exophiala oligosperma]
MAAVDIDMSEKTVHPEQIEFGTGEDVRFDPKRTKKLLRKLDRNLLPVVTVLYLLSYLDRANIGNARLAGLEKDLGMKGLDYNVAVAIFFPFYVAVEPISNIMLKKVRPSLWIASIMVAWGVICTLMGLVTNFGGFLAARAALGLAEGGLFPGINFIISMWYRRFECGFRMALFYSAATASGAFGGFLARAIVEMDGVGGKAGWSWIFIIEGLITVVGAVGAFFLLHDDPESSKFLSPDEKVEIARRLKEDENGLASEYGTRFAMQAVKDPKIWFQMLITFLVYTPVYCIALFLPTIVATLGYTNTLAQLMSAPPYVVACGFCILGGWAADRVQSRGIFMVGFQCVALVGIILQIAAKQDRAKYAGTYLLTIGLYPCVPMGTAWNSNNIGGSAKRAVGIAMQIAAGNLGGIASGFIYVKADGPRYIKGHSVMLGMIALSIILCALQSVYLRRENARRDATHKPLSEYTAQNKHEERELGDSATFYRFTV